MRTLVTTCMSTLCEVNLFYFSLSCRWVVVSYCGHFSIFLNGKIKSMVNSYCCLYLHRISLEGLEESEHSGFPLVRIGVPLFFWVTGVGGRCPLVNFSYF